MSVATTRRVFRPTTWVRVLVSVAAAFIALLGLGTVAVGLDPVTEDPSGPIVFGIVMLLWSFAIGWMVFRARVIADDRGVEVVNYLSRRRFAWDDIDRFEVGFAYWGVTLMPRRGAPMKVNAIQKPNLYHWLHKEARADRVVAELNAMLAERRMPPPRPDVERFAG